MNILERDQLEMFLSDHPDWEEDENGMLTARFEFDRFLQAIDFVNQVAEEAEVMEHHPDILIRYNEVTISTCTHEADGMITEKDIELVLRIEGLLE